MSDRVLIFGCKRMSMNGDLSRSQRLNADDATEVRHVQSPVSDARPSEVLNRHGELEVPDEVQRIGREAERGPNSVKIDRAISIPRPAPDWPEKVSREEVTLLVNAFEEALS